MYFDDRWSPVSGEDLPGFLANINPIGGKYEVKTATTQVHFCKVSFYKDALLLRVRDSKWEIDDLNIYYILHKETLYWLNGSSPPIHEINVRVPIKLKKNNILEYLRFFCFFVRTEEGPFLVVENIEDYYIPKGLDDKSRETLLNTIRPAVYKGRDKKRNFLCNASVYYSNAVFAADFSVQPGGMIEMLDDEPIAANLSKKINIPIF